MTLFRKTIFSACLSTAVLLFSPMVLADIKIVASFSILGDMVKQVAGDHGTVQTIVGPDADAHLYTPNVEDARAVVDADVIFTNGMGFETWSQALIDTSGAKAAVYVATDGISPLMVDGEVDPHAWNSLPNGITYIQNIVAGLSEADPTHADSYKANGQAYIARLEALHEEMTAKINTLPKSNRTIITAHDAFGYLADAYGLTFLAPVGIDTEAEPSARDMATLIDQIKEQGVGALFVENITSPALIKQIAAETGLSINGRLFSDALSEKGGPATSYVAMFEHNLGVIYDSLSTVNM